MKKIISICLGIALTQTACDLQPRVVLFPDAVGDFISARYPALLADPNTNPEIYNSAVTDYGIYESPDLYGTESVEDKVVYASADDYTMPVQPEISHSEPMYGSEPVSVPEKTQESVVVTSRSDISEDVIIVERGDTLYSIAKKHNTSVDALAQANNLTQPYQLSVGQKLVLSDSEAVAPIQDILVVNKPVSVVKVTTRVELSDITVQPGDTLYSLSRKYTVPVNDLAVMNKLTPPFNLSVGQKLRVPQSGSVVATEKTTQVTSVTKTQQSATSVKKDETVATQSKPVQTTKKISSDPSKKLPKITERSSSKFSWPVRGKILSAYGAKSNGLFNDGINISAKQGTAVKAAENGVVAYAGNEVKGMGNLIIIQHSGGWMTVYAHMDSMNVKRGTRVNVGQKIGAVGKTGKVDSPQLHFEIRKGTKAYNPNNYLK
jgi:murein DD-endopeptidase MepM/ murein hydrolase activator NlpD